MQSVTRETVGSVRVARRPAAILIVSSWEGTHQGSGGLQEARALCSVFVPRQRGDAAEIS